MIMNGSNVYRRRFVVGAMAGLLSVAGCIEPAGNPGSGGGSNSTEQHSGTQTTSDEGAVAYDDLSSEAQTEVKKAIQTGKYSECGSLALEKEVDLANDPVFIEYQNEVYETFLMVGSGKNEDCKVHGIQMEKTEDDTPTPLTDVVNFDALSADAQQEVEAAIQQDPYKSCNKLALADEIDLDSPPWIKYEGRYYRPFAEKQDSSSDTDCETVRVLRLRQR